MSAILGLVGTIPAGSVVFSVGTHEDIEAVILSQQENMDTSLYAFNYGQVKLDNTRAPNFLDGGEATWTSGLHISP